jgi:hypothetical protein
MDGCLVAPMRFCNAPQRRLSRIGWDQTNGDSMAIGPQSVGHLTKSRGVKKTRFAGYRAAASKVRSAGQDQYPGDRSTCLFPDDNGELVNVAGDWREIQGTMWAHDPRFFFTAGNVYKGNLGMVTMYRGRDRGHELLSDGINLRLPSGSHNTLPQKDGRALDLSGISRSIVGDLKRRA